MRDSLLGLLVAAAFGGAACNETTAPPPIPKPTSLTVEDSATVLEFDSTQLHAQVKDSAGNPMAGQTVTWLSTDTNVVTVSPVGMVHFRHAGRATIGVQSGKLTAQSTVVAAVQIQQMDLGSVYAQLSPNGCVVTSRGSVYCIDTQHQDSLRPIPDSVGSVEQVAVGTNQSCLLTTDGAAYCWGTNAYGQLGYDTTLVEYPPITKPLPEKGDHLYESITSGVSHACGMSSTRQVFCWGLNTSGQLGNGDTTVAYSATPLLVAGGLTFSAIAAGDYHTCGVTTWLAVYCWGSNSHMGLGSGDSTIARSYAPVAVSGATGVSQIVAGDSYSCTLAPPDSTKPTCWGNGEFGQLGIDSANLTSCPTIPSGFVCSNNPQSVAGGVAFQYVYAHAGLGNGLDGLTCGLTATGAAYCWGRNVSGELGDGTNTQRYTPVAVSGGLTFTTLATGDFHACGLAGGIVYCWGYTMGLHPARIPDQP